MRLIPGGARVEGQTTLDLCNGSFPSEALRTERLQDVALDSSGAAVISTEAVFYRNRDATAQAFQELRNVAATCPTGPVTNPSDGTPSTTTFEAPPDSTWPQTASVDRQAYSFVTTDDTGTQAHSIAVYLRRGRVLLGIYFPRPDITQSPVGGQTTIRDIVTLFANRIAQLPAATVNGIAGVQ